MNEKFLARGKRLEIGPRIVTTSDEWIYGYYVYGSISTYIYSALHNPKMVSVDPKTVGRCTGLPDKNGKMIFEGDIVKGVVLSSEFIGDIVWIEEIASFGIGHRDKREPTAWENSSLFKRLRLGYKDQFAAEIIGNIHDNPELIGGAE